MGCGTEFAAFVISPEGFTVFEVLLLGLKVKLSSAPTGDQRCIYAPTVYPDEPMAVPCFHMSLNAHFCLGPEQRLQTSYVVAKNCFRLSVFSVLRWL
ncbi:hypothetical protein LshimejAT787_0311370 [Lyophyllum shimeji]|uniref:Uncharacterized protein n=1 Tax=Lyophyllum shimeji TaxID=47721 RepID=A0A9P3UMJ8_LYOSH|nr:hypothetical protein LshimejAT787_0311370 [Lyophyllum shimeji]